jgi:hypothetical protein
LERPAAPPVEAALKNGVMADAHDLRIPFLLRDIGGLIDVSVTRNVDPESIGYAVLSYGLPVDFARGFPVCRATVSYPADGYAAIFGRTQLVRSTDSATRQFEMDPIAIYRDVATPFAWYGIRPQLFDAPARDPRADMDWEGGPGTAGMERPSRGPEGRLPRLDLRRRISACLSVACPAPM